MIHSQQCFSFSIDDDNFFHHLRSIHKCAIKYVQKYFLNARGQPRKWLLALFYGVLLQLQLLPGLLLLLLLLLLMLFCLCNAVHGCIINYAYQSTEKGVKFCRWPAMVPFTNPLPPYSSLSNEAQRSNCQGRQRVQLIWVHSTGNKYEVLNTRYAHFSAAKLLPQHQSTL